MSQPPANPPAASPAQATEPAGPSLAEVVQNVERGFLSAHSQLSQSFGNLFMATATLRGLTKLLIDKGLLDAAEVGAAVKEAEDELRQSDFGKGLQFVLLADAPDKYKAEPVPVNCAERLHLCHAACCTLDVVLSPQDIEEGVARWDLGRPYQLRRLDDGYCCHANRATGGCNIYGQRPLVCRTYSCAADRRIWLDFDKMVPNAEYIGGLLERRDRPRLRGCDAGAADGYEKAATLTAVGPAAPKSD